MASNAIVTVWVTGRSPGSDAVLYGAGRVDDFATLVVAARRTDVMRPLEFSAVAAFDERRRLQGVMGTSLVTSGFRRFFLRYSHIFDL